MDYAAKFDHGLKYADFLSKYGNDEQQARWNGFHMTVELTDAQKELLDSFKREMKIMVVAGAWCGDCVNQCPIFDHFESNSSAIRIRYFDRDDNPELADDLSMCGGRRVPSVLFLSEDGLPCGRYGDRTLSKYRDMAATQLGAACPTGIGLPDKSLTERVVQDWLDEFERIQLMLRTSARLREIHGD
jgi:thiol-disulfide isomerase/thioredoxin